MDCIKSIMNRKTAFVFILSILIFVETQGWDSNVGDACQLHNNSFGTCKLVSTCDWLRETLRKKSMTFDEIVRCGFNGSEPIVCCADDRQQPIDRIVPITPVLNSTEDPTDVLPIRVKPTAEACQNYTKIAISYSSTSVINLKVAESDYPHMAALGYPNQDGGHVFECGGALISDQWVVTAGHCVTKKRPPTLIRMGVVFLDEDDVEPVDRTVIQRVRHPSYNAEFKQNDIALLQLDRPVPFNDYVRPACIRTQVEDVSSTTELIIIGWGSILAEKGERPPVLQQANVTIVPLTSCNATLSKYNELADQPSLRKGLRDSQLCALDTTAPPDKIQDACVGDSGGPIFTHSSSGVSSLIGVVSFGVSCGTHLPSVYTRIASYLDWIESVVWAK